MLVGWPVGGLGAVGGFVVAVGFGVAVAVRVGGGAPGAVGTVMAGALGSPSTGPGPGVGVADAPACPARAALSAATWPGSRLAPGALFNDTSRVVPATSPARLSIARRIANPLTRQAL